MSVNLAFALAAVDLNWHRCTIVKMTTKINDDDGDEDDDDNDDDESTSYQSLSSIINNNHRYHKLL